MMLLKHLENVGNIVGLRDAEFGTFGNSLTNTIIAPNGSPAMAPGPILQKEIFQILKVHLLMVFGH